MEELIDVAGDPQRMHAALVHLPVAGALLGVPLVAALAATGGRNRTLRWSVVGLYVALALVAVAAVNTGAGAKAELGEVAVAARALVERHEHLARRVWIVALLPAGATFGLASRWASARRAALAACSLGALACAGWVGIVGHLGGTAVYAYGAGTPHPVVDSGEDSGDGAPADGSRAVPGDPRAVHFREVVRPLLAGTCMGCHGPGSFAAGGLDLTSMRTLLEGGSRGPAVVPGDAEASLLLQAVAGTHAELRMPQGRPALEPRQVDALRTWIEQGAVWAAE